jgi:hypothetical protein
MTLWKLSFLLEEERKKEVGEESVEFGSLYTRKAKVMRISPSSPNITEMGEHVSGALLVRFSNACHFV